MKHFIIFSVFLLCAVSCRNESGPKPEQIAHTFLTAYFQIDYDQVLPMCGPELKADLAQSAERVSQFTPEMQNKLRQDLSEYSFKIEDVGLNPAKDTALVNYLVFTPEAPQGLPGDLTMARKGQEWKIIKLVK